MSALFFTARNTHEAPRTLESILKFKLRTMFAHIDATHRRALQTFKL